MLIVMEINFANLLNISAKIASAFFILFLTVSCTYKEPPFSLMGDQAITKDIKVNIEMVKDNGSTVMATAFYNGKSYNINNQGVLHYIIYVSYKNQYFIKLKWIICMVQ